MSSRLRVSDAFIREIRDEPLPSLPGYRPTFGLVLRVLVGYADNWTGDVHVSLSRLIADTGLGRRTVLAGIAWAESVGWVDTLRRGRRGRTAERRVYAIRGRTDYAP